MSLPIPDKKKRVVPSFEEVMGKKSVPSYEDVMDQKKNLGGNDLKNGSPISPDLNVEIPTVSLEDDNQKDIFTLADEHNALSNKKQLVSEPMGSSFAMGTNSEIEIPDEKAQKQAANLKDFMVNAKGADPIDINEEIKGVPKDVLEANKGKLIEDRETNNPLYHRQLARYKWSSGLQDELIKGLEDGKLTPDEYNTVRHNMDMITESTGQGDYSNQRGAVQSLAKDIQLYGGENKDKLLKDFAVEVSKVYGNAPDNNFSKGVENSPESKYLNNDEQLGLHYLKDIAPEKASQYERLFVDPKTLEGDALKGANHLHQTLEETGIGLQENAIQEELNSLKKVADKNGGLDETQITKATELEKKQEVLEQKKIELDKKYPERVTNKVADAVNEVMGKDINWGEYAMVKTGQALKNTGQGIWEAVSEPFMSDASNNLRELSIMGESITDENNLKQPDKNKSLLYDQLIIQPDLQKQVDAIKDSKDLNDKQKRDKLFSLFYNNKDKFGRVPIQDGKFNISPSSILYGITDLGASLLPFVGLEAATGGIGGAGTAAKFLRTFTAAAATTFHDEYARAIEDGKPQSEAYKAAMGATAINSLAMAGAGTPTEIRALASGNKSFEKVIAQMSDDEIKNVLSKGTPKGLKAFGQSFKDRIKATPEMIGQGLKTGAKFEAAMAGANTLNDREVNFKQMVLNVANFGIIGAGLGHIGYKSPTELQKSGLVKMGENPEEFHATALQMKKDGTLSPSEYDHRVDLINRSEEAIKTLPKANDKGKPLDEKQKGEYLYNSVIKNEGNKAKSTLPPRQAEKAEHTAKVADYANGLILEQPTDKQLESRKSGLEKKLEKKDEEGKLELTDKDRKDAQAELEAIDNTIKMRENNITVEAPKKVAEPVPDTKPTDVVDDEFIVDKDGNKYKVSVEKDGDTIYIYPKDNNGESVGSFELFKKEDGTYHPQWISVDKKMQRKAIATSLFEYAENKLGLKLSENTELSQDGKKFIESIKKSENKPNDKINEQAKEDEVHQSTEIKGDTNIEPDKVSSKTKAGEKEPPKEPAEPVTEGGDGKKVGVSHESLTDLAKRLNLKEPETGEWHSPEWYAERGRELLKGGAKPEEVNNPKNELHDRISIARAHLENIVKEADTVAREKGIESPEYKEAHTKVNDYANDVVKKLGTKAGQAMTALQGERDIDTDSFTAVKKAAEEGIGKPLNVGQEVKVQELTKKNQELKKQAEEAEAKLVEETEKAFNAGVEEGKKLSKSDKAKKIADKLREKAKLSKPDSFSAATPASVVWDAAVEIVAKGIEAGGKIADVIHEGLDYIKNSDWYKGLDDEKKKSATEDFKQFANDKTGSISLEDMQKRFVDKKGNKFTPDEARDIWKYAKEKYLDEGVSFRDMIAKVSNDLGLSWRQVSEAITSKKTQRIADEMWKKQADYSKNRSVTKNWIESQNKSLPFKALRKVSAAFRGVSVFGHGGIFIGTHAGMTLFNPSQWKVVIPAFIRGWKFAYGDKAKYERRIEQLRNDPNYVKAQRAGLKNNPDNVNTEEFQKSQKFFEKIGGEAGIKGFNAIKVLRQDIFNLEYDKLSETEKNDPTSLEQIARLANNATGATNLKLPEWVNEVTFAGGMEATRWGKLTRNPARATSIAVKALLTPSKATIAERVFAKVWARRVGEQVGTMATLLIANSLIQNAVNPNNPTNLTDPNKPDYLKFKFGDLTIDPSSGMRGTAMFIYGIGKIPFETKKQLRGDTRTQALGKNSITYIRGKLAPLYSTMADFFAQQDFNRNPMPFSSDTPSPGHHKLTWKEYAWQKAPLPVAHAAQDMYHSALDNAGGTMTSKHVVDGIISGVLSGGTGFRIGEYNSDDNTGIEDKKSAAHKFLKQKDAGIKPYSRENLKPVDESGKDIPVTGEKYKKFMVEREKIIADAIDALLKGNGVYEDEDGIPHQISAKDAKDITDDELKSYLMSQTTKADKEAMEKVFNGTQKKEPKTSRKIEVWE